MTDELKVLQQRNRELEAEALCMAGRIQDAIDTALAVSEAEHAAAVAALRRELDTVMEALSTTTTERDEAQRDLLAATVRADGLAAQITDLQSRRDLHTQPSADLGRVQETRQDRPRRKEQKQP